MSDSLDDRSLSPGVILRFAGIALWIPRVGLETLEPLLDIRAPAAAPAIGCLRSADGDVPVYCCGPDLEPLTELEGVRRMCAVLRATDGLLALACDDITAVAAGAVRPVDLPACQASPATPVLGLAMHDGRVLAVSDADHIAGWLALHGAAAGPGGLLAGERSAEPGHGAGDKVSPT